MRGPGWFNESDHSIALAQKQAQATVSLSVLVVLASVSVRVVVPAVVLGCSEKRNTHNGELRTGRPTQVSKVLATARFSD
jgi:hypothetical protein